MQYDINNYQMLHLPGIFEQIYMFELYNVSNTSDNSWVSEEGIEIRSSCRMNIHEEERHHKFEMFEENFELLIE